MIRNGPVAKPIPDLETHGLPQYVIEISKYLAFIIEATYHNCTLIAALILSI